MRRDLALIFAALLAPTGAAAQTAAGFSVEPATSQIHVDARLDEKAWEAAAVIPLTHEWFPGDNTEPPVATVALVTFDSTNFYVGFRASDPDPSAIRAYLADRDTAFSDDTVGFILDTFNDRRRAFQFRINALGVQMEAQSSDIDGTEDWSWDIIWNSAGRITDVGYVVEVAIPLKQLRFPRTTASEVQTWGFLAMRDYPRNVRHRLRSVENDRDKNCFVCQAPSLTGFRHLEPGRNLELDPTVTMTRTDSRDFPDGVLESGDEDAEAGLTVRWNVTPNLALNATLNPDFSQVEADAAQLDVNERFALFFPEKRPFFLEGADFFNSPFDVVFTRTVADPKYGVKLTGKQGRDSFGVFLAEDRINNLIFPGNQGSSSESLSEDVLSGVVRYRRDVGKRSNLGFLYAGRQGDGDYANEVYGVDGTLRLTDSDTVRFQALGSRTEYPEGLALEQGQPLTAFDGTALRIDYTHGERNWFWSARYQDIDPDFRADSGRPSS